MPDDTPILALPLILPAQAQKHVTHNEALRLLDILVQLTVRDRHLAAPPAAPAEGECYVVAANASAAWAGQTGRIAAFWGGVWVFLTPRPGWTARVLDENLTLVFRDGGWEPAVTLPETLPRLGINAPPDDVNRLSLGAAASLFSHAGMGHQIKVNKAAPAHTASLLFQTNFSGRAEMGLTGSDAFSIKVSANGAEFATALTATSTGEVTLPQAVTVGGALSLAGPVSGAAVQSGPSDGTAGRLMTTGAFGLGTATAPLIAGLDATATLAGTWRTADGATAGTWPPGATTATLRAGLLTVTRPDAAVVMQSWQQRDSGRIWTRRFSAGWSAWAEVWTTTAPAAGDLPVMTTAGPGRLPPGAPGTFLGVDGAGALAYGRAGGFSWSGIIATSSGTAFDFSGIPAWATEMKLLLNGVCLNQTDGILLQLGTAAGLVGAGYIGTATFFGRSNVAGVVGSSAGFPMPLNSPNQGAVGEINLSRMSTTTWIVAGAGRLAGDLGYAVGGLVTLASTLTLLRVTRQGASSFQAGFLSLGWR